MTSLMDLPPEYVVEIRDPAIGLEGFVVIDNTALGPGKGGIRFVEDVTVDEVKGLAKAMTLKNAIAGLPLGGAKAGIRAKPGVDKNLLVRAFAKRLKAFRSIYVSGPDMYMGEEQMAIIADEVGRDYVTGKPLFMGGLPHELGSTGFGVAVSAREALKLMGDSLEGKTVAIEGFGNVGTFAATFLSQWGAKVVAVSDRKGAIYVPEGIDVELLKKIKAEKGSVIYYGKGQVLEKEKLFELPVDILIPGARPNVITMENAPNVKASLIVEAANLPIPAEVEDWLEERGKVVIPDVVANAGGVISSYAEMLGLTPKLMFQMVEEKITSAVEEVWKRRGGEKPSTRRAAVSLAEEVVFKAMELREKGLCS